jgi:hypothetical protein
MLNIPKFGGGWANIPKFGRQQVKKNPHALRREELEFS